MAATAEKKNLMLSKFALLERMERLLDEQRRDLANDDIVRLAGQCREVDRIIQEIKVIDDKLAGLADNQYPPKTAFDDEVDRVAFMVTELAEKNRGEIGELLRKLNLRQAELKGELGSTAATDRISGCQPFQTQRPVNLDSRN